MATERRRGGRRAPRAETAAPGRRGAGPLAALVLTLMLTGAVAAGTSTIPAMALMSPIATTTTNDSDETAIALVAAPAASGITRAGDPLSVRVTVTNLGDAATPALTIELAIAGSEPTSAEDTAAWFNGESVALEEQVAASAELSPLDPGSSAVLDLIVDDAATVLSGTFGARAAVVRASADGSLIVADRTALVWVPGSAAPAAQTLFVAPLSTPGIEAGLLTGAQLERLTGDAGALTRQLDAVAGRPVVVAIDPRVVASIRLLGTSAPTSAIAFLDRLASMPNETFLLPWADADVVAVLAAGESMPQPEGAGVPGTTTEAAATDDPAPGPVSLTLADAADWPATLRDVVWSDDSIGPAIATALTDAGTRLVIAPTSPAPGGTTVQQAGGLRLLRVDAALSASARDASTAPSQQRFDRAIARMSALLAAAADERPGIPAIIALTRDELPSSDRLIDTIGRTVSLPWSTASSATEALSTPAADAALSEPAADPARHAAIRDAIGAETADRAFASIATTPATITDPRRLELLAALSAGWGDHSVTALERFVDSSIALRQSVRVAESSAITLFADRASLPVTVQNDLDVAVQVFVRVDPDTTQLRVLDQRVSVLVEPRSQTRALVPVESLTNGQVDITVTVQDATGARIGSPTRVALNLQAGWETAGTIAVAGAVVLLLGIGITRDIRKRRRQRAEDE